MLCWQSVSHSFGPTEVLSDFSLTVAPGQIISIVGPSGCGKTTALQMAAALLEPTEGRVDNGFSHTSYVFQEPRLLPWRRAIDNIAFGLKALGRNKRDRHLAARRLAARLELAEDDLDKYPHELSGGMRQRVSLARALAVEPDLLLLDEPFSALDIGLKRELQNLLVSLIDTSRMTAVFVTHDLAEAVRISQRIIVMDRFPLGKVHSHGIEQPFVDRDDPFVYQTVAELLSVDAVSRAFHRIDDETSTVKLR